MAKKIYSQFDGLYTSDKNVPDNMFNVGVGVDLSRDEGYLMPGFAKTDITITGLSSPIQDIILDGVNGRAFIFTNSAKIYAVDTSTNADMGDSFGGGSQNYVTIANMSESKGLIYSLRDTSTTTASTRYAVFAYNGNSKDIARGSLLSGQWGVAGNLVQNYGSGSCTGGAGLNNGRRDIIEWQQYLWFTNGRYVGRLDGTQYPNVMSPLFFDLGVNWTADRLFITGSYLGIIASRNTSLATPTTDRARNECRVYLIDGTSQTKAVKIIPLENINQVHAVANYNGSIICFADNRATGHIIAQLGEFGLDKISDLKQEISGTLNTLLSPPSSSAVENYKNNLLFGVMGVGTNTGRGLIMSYGKNKNSDNLSLSCPMFASLEANSKVYSIKQISTDKIYCGYFDGTNSKFTRFTSGYAAATYKPGYMDFGQKVRINYIKVYFKTLVSGDSVTVSIDTDYGTSNSLDTGSGNLSYAKYGAINSKRFSKPIVCHAFRPSLAWVSGGVTFSKIVIDYDFIDDI